MGCGDDAALHEWIKGVIFASLIWTVIVLAVRWEKEREERDEKDSD